MNYEFTIKELSTKHLYSDEKFSRNDYNFQRRYWSSNVKGLIKSSLAPRKLSKKEEMEGIDEEKQLFDDSIESERV